MSPRSLPVIGLTGAVGAGKSTAAAEFARRGCRVLDVDRMGHEALDLPAVRDAVVALLGREVLREDGRIDRAGVARRVFGEPTALASLEAIVHPAVGAQVREMLARPDDEDARAAVIDCALLFESGLDRLCDVTLCVRADAATRRRRVAATRGWSAEEVARREAAQLPAEQKAARADRVIDNDADPHALASGIERFLDEWLPAATPDERRFSR